MTEVGDSQLNAIIAAMIRGGHPQNFLYAQSRGGIHSSLKQRRERDPFFDALCGGSAVTNFSLSVQVHDLVKGERDYSAVGD